MGSEPFHFKQFTVHQHQSTHKVGTDGVLLGAWVDIYAGDKSILDIGTGSGLIALMLAQRTDLLTRIDGVEIEKQDVEQARINVDLSPWGEKIKIYNVAAQDFFSETKYDLIVSNPPYFMNSWLPPEKKRSQARHAHQLSYQDLLINSTRLLTSNGRLAVILPFIEGLHFVELANDYKLFVIRQSTFRSRIHKPVERLLLELSPKQNAKVESEIVLYSEGENWSEAYRTITRDFYLKC
jgi:tRNA1Val (adenine37-N6)-methyltransferase